ncbi:response regulator [Alteraurantiacibacter aquimixticola]|uniref:Response regulator n=1 Tax=Alteraurantiacibacter aquimixticola TaxID=2489173 RepID=A0A4T3F3Y1_9SPHN|nr:response regulator [Alteraurantiacibacter aquimixticola]TIX51996.1 response regulator [Alteraurantiacibacter aquimixticola]
MAHILVVDDDEIVAELASEILISAGHACGWVTDAAEALKLLQWRRPDLLLLDENMPGESGSTFLRRLRQSPKFYDLPVMMFTSVQGPEDETRAYYNGAQDYIRKPVQPKFLVWRVNQTLRSRAERPKHRELKDMAEFQMRNRDDDKPRQVYL